MSKIILIKGDITELEVDAIVNAANRSLLGGGGVDGAIHRKAGIGLLEECKILGGCNTGEAKITKGYNLKAKFVIHTVGPIYGRENGREADSLRGCYWNSLEIAIENKIKTIAFPAISTGIYGYPKEDAAKIAIKTVRDYIDKNKNIIDEVIFVLFSDIDYETYNSLINK
jgi:O-acetyl-ADP-ribose deacetylase